MTIFNFLGNKNRTFARFNELYLLYQTFSHRADGRNIILISPFVFAAKTTLKFPLFCQIFSKFTCVVQRSSTQKQSFADAFQNRCSKKFRNIHR